jgi:heme-degrading monooxygenase HmoA
MITRIFRVRIDPNLRDEFERKFADVSVKAVESSRGFITVTIGKPTKWAPDEYVMISQWENEAAIKNFAGEAWNQAHIPSGMEKFVREYWVHHYVSFDHA